MSSEKLLSLCPKAVVIAKENRESWAYEEILDGVARDTTTNVRATKFKGVFLVYSGLPVCDLERILLSYEYSFIKYIIFINICFKYNINIKYLIKIIEEICNKILKSKEKIQINIRLKLRGPHKKIAHRSVIEKTVKEAGCLVNRRSNYCLAIESVGEDWIGISFGRILGWNYNCNICSPCRISKMGTED